MTDNIPTTPEARKKWLLKPENRDPIARGGAGSIYYKGDVKSPKNLKIVVSTRAARVGQGLAHFGGLSEDCDTVKDNKIQTGKNNACREGREEMAELLGYEPELDVNRYHHLYTAHDDGFFIRNGKGFAVNASLHSYEMDDKLYNALFPNGALRRDRDPDHDGAEETSHAEVISFFDALKRQNDYFYAHEYFALWVMAAHIMQCDVVKLAEEVNADMKGKAARVDFNDVAARMHTDLKTLEQYLGKSYAGKLTEYEARFKKKPFDKKFAP